MVSAAAHRHQDSLGLSFKQVGLRFHHTLSLDQHRLTLGCADSTWILRHPAFPLVHQLLSVRVLDTFYLDLYDILWCIFISAMQIAWWEESPWNTSLQLLLLFTDTNLGATFGGKIALRAGGRRQWLWSTWSRLALVWSDQKNNF